MRLDGFLPRSIAFVRGSYTVRLQNSIYGMDKAAPPHFVRTSLSLASKHISSVNEAPPPFDPSTLAT